MSNVNIDRQLKKEAKAAFSEDEDMSKRDTGPKFKTPSASSSIAVEEEAKKLGKELFGDAALKKRRRLGNWKNLSTVLLLFVAISFFTAKHLMMKPSISHIYFDNYPSFKTLPERDSSGTIPPTFKLQNNDLTDYELNIDQNTVPRFYFKLKPIHQSDSASKFWISDRTIKESSDIGFSTRFFGDYNGLQNTGTLLNTSRKLDLVDSLMQTCQYIWNDLRFYDVTKNAEPLNANQIFIDSLKRINSLRLIVDIDLLEYAESSHQNEYGEIQNTASIKYILKGIKPKTREVLFAESIQANVTMEQPAGFDLEKANTPLYKCSPAMLLVKKQVLQKSLNCLKPYLEKL